MFVHGPESLSSVMEFYRISADIDETPVQIPILQNKADFIQDEKATEWGGTSQSLHPSHTVSCGAGWVSYMLYVVV